MVWGTGDMGQLGLGEDVQEKARPFPLPLGSPVLKVACGGMHTLAVTAGGQLFSWGVNDEGALGRAVRPPSLTPSPPLPSTLSLNPRARPAPPPSCEKHRAWFRSARAGTPAS